MTKYSKEMRKKAAELIEQGHGAKSIAFELAISLDNAREWICTYKSAGRKIFLEMGSKHKHYDYETKLAAARDFVEFGLTKQEVMAKYHITNMTQVKDWAYKYREGGEKALLAKQKCRPRKASQESASPKTREQELEIENRRLKTEVAYLKKLRALEAEKQAFGKNVR